MILPRDILHDSSSELGSYCIAKLLQCAELVRRCGDEVKPDRHAMIQDTVNESKILDLKSGRIITRRALWLRLWDVRPFDSLLG